MNNITKGLAYLLVMCLLLTAGGFYYHKTATPETTPTPTPTPTPEPTPSVVVTEEEFIAQSTSIYNYALQQFQNDSSLGGLETSYCNVEGCINTLSQSFEGYNYSITISAGKVLKYYITNGVYQYFYVGDELKTEMISNPGKISELDPSEVITITSNM